MELKLGHIYGDIVALQQGKNLMLLKVLVNEPCVILSEVRQTEFEIINQVLVSPRKDNTEFAITGYMTDNGNCVSEAGFLKGEYDV